MIKPQQNLKSYIFIAFVILFVIVCTLAIVYFYKNYHEQRVINSTNAQLDASLDSNYVLLSPQLEKFGLHLAKPGKSTCGQGDPSLYKYSCGASADIDKDTEPETLATGGNAARVLSNFDVFMRKNKYTIIGNDFRRMRIYEGTQWATDIASRGVTVEYLSKKDSCSVSFQVSLSKPSYNIGSGGGLYCGTTLFPVTDN